MNKELLKGLSEEQIAKIKDCKTQEDLLRVAKEEGIELTDEQLEAVTGGACTTPQCPNCGASDYDKEWFFYSVFDTGYKYTCHKCGNKWVK